MKYTLTLAAFLFAAPLFGQHIEIPAEIPAQPGAWVVVSPVSDCKAITYVGLDGLSAFPSSELKDPKKLVVNAAVPGRYRFTAVGSLNDVHTTASFTIVVGNVPPAPSPVPPGPTPTPPTPAPIPGPGLTAIFVYESATLSSLPPAQLAVLYSQSLRQYMAGKQFEFRFYDADVVMTGESAKIQAAMKRPRAALPWVIISNGTTGFEGPCPASIDDTLALLKKYAGG